MLHALAAARRGEDSRKLLADAFRRDPVQQRSAIAQRRIGGGLDREAQPRGETHRPQQAQAVLLEARLRIADGADHARLEIRQPADEVDDLAGFRDFKQAVDGEIPALRIFLGCRERHALRTSSVLVAAVRAKGGDLHVVAAVFRDHHAEVRAHFVRSGKQLHHLRRRGRGGDVEVLRLVFHQPVPHAATGEIRLVPGGLQPAGELQRRVAG